MNLTEDNCIIYILGRRTFGRSATNANTRMFLNMIILIIMSWVTKCQGKFEKYITLQISNGHITIAGAIITFTILGILLFVAVLVTGIMCQDFNCEWGQG